MATNLPAQLINDSGASTVLFFDSYGEAPLEFSSIDVDLTVGFFKSSGFDKDAAELTAMTILRQAKLEGEPVSAILDTIKGLGRNELSLLVAEILNNGRVATSFLGYRVPNVTTDQTRQIAA
jgi:hypothetical protein